MKTQLLSLGIIVMLAFLVGCSGSQQKKLEEITRLETSLLDPERVSIDMQTATQLISSYIAYVEEFPSDPQSPVYLFKAGELSMNINQGSQALQYLEQLRNTYPDFEKMAEVIFIEAFIYESMMNNTEKAREFFEMFVERYPEHELYQDASVSLRNLGKTLEEIVEEFEKLNAQ